MPEVTKPSVGKMPSKVGMPCVDCGEPVSWKGNRLGCANGHLRDPHHYSTEEERQVRRERSRVYMVQERNARRVIVKDLKAGPCSDCGHSHPHYVMEFDHVRGEKRFDIAAGMLLHHRCTRDEMLAEIAKCDLVCANCHRVRTFSREGEWTS
jgi:hypothetical protein